jgi:AAA+ superfamily predicted ATPase
MENFKKIALDTFGIVLIAAGNDANWIDDAWRVEFHGDLWIVLSEDEELLELIEKIGAPQPDNLIFHGEAENSEEGLLEILELIRNM